MATATPIRDGTSFEEEGARVSITQRYLVTGIDPEDTVTTEDQVKAALPANGTPWPSDPYTHLRKTGYRLSEYLDGKTQAFVDVLYRSPNYGVRTGSSSDRSPIIRGGVQYETRELLRDFSTSPKDVVNTAKQPYDPAPTVEVGVPYWQVTCWYTDTKFRSDIFPLIREMPIINSGAFSIDSFSFGARQLMLQVDDFEKEENGSADWWRVTWRFLVDERTHDLRLLSFGRAQLVGGDIKPIIVDGQQIVDPVPLDVDGVPALVPHEQVFWKRPVVSFAPIDWD